MKTFLKIPAQRWTSSQLDRKAPSTIDTDPEIPDGLRRTIWIGFRL